jgi:hypothetical protein
MTRPYDCGEYVPGHIPTFTLERQVNEARRLMGEARWLELQAEWTGLSNKGGDR